jgi:PDZ domain-containing protein
VASNVRKKRIGLLAIVFVIIAALFVIPVDAYISQPGGAYDLKPLVEVEGGDKNDLGTFSLMTISLAKANAFSYTISQFSDKRKVLPVERVRKAGENDKEYNVRQKKLMSTSQFNAITVAFEKAGIPVEIDYDGVFVMSVMEGAAAQGILHVGDKIRSIDGVKLVEPGQFYTLIAEKKLGDTVQMSLDRDAKPMDVSVTLKKIPNEQRAGLGVEFAEDKMVSTDPKVEIHTSNIGGPSAGLMFTLEIMNQLLDEDLTKGYKIAGTGEMLGDGTVGRIGGADFKVIAASKAGVEYFFAPSNDFSEAMKKANPGILTNYQEAVQMAEKIGTKMTIVPVETIDDALAFLTNLEPK